MAKNNPAEEFFYLDKDGNKQDSELHGPILRAVDFPIDEKIMGPIRERNRAKYLAEQEARRQDARRSKAWQRAKRRAYRLIRDYRVSEAYRLLRESWNEADHPRDEEGKFTEAGGGAETGGKSEATAASLLQVEDVTVDDLYAKFPDSRAQVAAARSKLKESVPTDSPVEAGGHKLPNGHWAPDRIPVHRQIAQKLMPPEQVAAATPQPGEQPTLYILGGRGGSGKGWFTKSGSLAGIKDRAVYINSDDVKEALPEYQGWNAALLHEESSHVGQEMEKYARDNRLHTIIDATLKNGLTTEERVNAFKAAGYKISGHYMYASPATAAERALGRFVHGNARNGKGRFVPPEYSLGSVTNEKSFDAQRDKMDFWEIYDNSGSAPKLYARKGG